jgi:putative transposase
VLVDEIDLGAYRRALARAAASAGVVVHGYGLFETEVRLLLTPARAPDLGTMMQSLGRHFVRAFNQRHGRSGSPWEGRYRSTVVEPDLYLPCLRFVEGGDVDSAGPVLATSLTHHLGGKVDPLLIEHGAFWGLGNTPFDREVAYRQYLARSLDPVLAGRLRDAVLKGWALGSPAFVASLSTLGVRRGAPVKKGRPPKPKPDAPGA